MRRWLDAEAEAKYTSCFKAAIGKAVDCKAIPKDYKMLLKHPDSRVSSRCPDLEPWISAQIDAFLGCLPGLCHIAARHVCMLNAADTSRFEV